MSRYTPIRIISAGLLVLVLLLTTFPGSQAQATGPEIFINEIHYDNAGTDAGEAVEIAGPAGTDLSGWSLVLYNGSTGAVYNTTALSGTIPDQQDGYGTLSFSYPVNGLQNGSPDGLALVDAASLVVQFLSYEGVFTAADGPAAGMTSVDIGVSESSSTVAGDSLQLVGTGEGYDDFSWAAAAANTFGAVNTGQIFVGDTPDSAPAVSFTSPADSALDVALNVNLEITFSEAVDLAPGWFEISCNTSGIHTAVASGGPTVFVLDPDLDFVNDEICTVSVSASLVADQDLDDPPDVMDADYVYGFTTVGAISTADFMFINEVDADNPGTDAAEFIELYDGGVGNTDLTGLVLVLFNGSDDASYLSFDLDGYSTDGAGYFVLCGDSANVANCDLDVSPNTNLIQNGADAVALLIGDAADFPTDTPVTASGLLDAIVYDTNDGDDAGLLPLLNAGQPQVNEGGGGNSSIHSNQRCPNGSGGQRNTDTYTQIDPTPGGENGCVVPPPEIVINEFSASTTGSDVEYLEVFGSPFTDFSNFVILEIEGDAGSNEGTVDEVVSLGTTDADGFYLVSLPANALENDTISLLLVENFTGTLGDDLDVDDDGVLDSAPWDALIDAVSVNDGEAGALTYGIPVLSGNYDGVSSFPPGGASRIPDGNDTDTSADWVRNDFHLAGIPGETGSLGPGEALNTPGTFNEVYVAPPESCGDPFTPIYAIQGNGFATPLAGTVLSTEGIVVGDYQIGKKGYFIQSPVGDGDLSTSDGIFVYDTTPDVDEGDFVRVRGTAVEYNDLTEITDVVQVWDCGTGTVAATPLTLPLDAISDLEAYEGMLVEFTQDLYISEYYEFGRFGEIVLTTSRQFQPTSIYEPGSPEAAQLAVENQLARIKLDDGRTWQNPDPALHPNGAVFDLTNLFRGGDRLTSLLGVVDYNFGEYKIQPVAAVYVGANPRPAAPDFVGDGLKVASFNVLNYFTTLGSRGADTALELERQRAKIIAALQIMDADVVGLIEIENNTEAIVDLVNGLNDAMGAGTYNYVDTGVIGTDEIKVAFIYKPATVALEGDHAILDSSVDSRFIDTKNRPALAQSFMDTSTGGVFTVVVNHLKSKGSPCDDVGDPNMNDGAGNCNLTRTSAAEALVDWLATDPTGSGDADFMIIGDLNAYDKEDPIDAIIAGGYGDLVFQFIGEDAYSYVFDGQLGYLDHAMAMTNGAMSGEISGATIWHINADEPNLIDYDMTWKKDAQDALYAPDPFRSSDHDPVIIGLDVCDEIDPSLSIELSLDILWPPNHKLVEISANVNAEDNFDPGPTVSLVSIVSSEEGNNTGDGNTEEDIVILDDFRFLLRAERSAKNMDGRTYLVTYQVEDDCGNRTLGYATVKVPFSMGRWFRIRR